MFNCLNLAEKSSIKLMETDSFGPFLELDRHGHYELSYGAELHEDSLKFHLLCSTKKCIAYGFGTI